MRHTTVSGAWRPLRRKDSGRALGVVSAFVFNLCLLALPIASAMAFIIIARDKLYAYEYSEAGAHVIRARVERLNGELIQLDFDRQRQWDDLVAMELMAEDIEAARGFLLSAPGMLPERERDEFNRRLPSGADDAQAELVALSFLTPGTRSRYESMTPLLSRRTATPVQPLRGQQTLADTRDFELMAQALLAEPSTDGLQFILSGFSLDLANSTSPRVAAGAAALLAASRRDDYPQGLAAQVDALAAGALPIESFRQIALHQSQNGDPASFANASAAFRTAVNQTDARRLDALLEQIGLIVEATSQTTAVALVTHASDLRDIPKLRLVAQATGARVAAAAKRQQRDGRLVSAASGQLSFNSDLLIAIAAALAAALGAIGILAANAYARARNFWLRLRGIEEDGLVDLGGSNWRPI